jgi:hypothetical protein
MKTEMQKEKDLNMNKRVMTFPLMLGLAVILCGLALPATLRAQVGDGWNAFDTISGPTTYDGMLWQGVPLGSFTFGTNGTVNTYNTDTIIQRTGAPVTTPGGTMALNVVALQLQTLTPVSLGGGPVGYYYATLDPNQTSAGLLTIDSFPSDGSPGTFHDYFSVYFDIHYGSLTGPIVAEPAPLTLVASGDWWPTAPANPPAIGHQDNAHMGDLHVVSLDVDFDANDPDLVDGFYPTPEPSSLALIGLGALVVTVRARRGRK